ncbi:hypothetical protein DK389_20965 [Methylobacterium durans]|uniref:Uncharacterized protein n=1 Tax=Methylobacterium durans TaxID=2202825 RepID=A0A2U8WAQ5_9HYPH|nr:hypothetical protein DK389_20965 [Methylobacterium durans]
MEDGRPARNRLGPVLSDGFGEDLLDMHGRMIATVRDMAGPEMPGSWASIPGPAGLVAEPGLDNPAPLSRPAGNADGFAVPPCLERPGRRARQSSHSRAQGGRV